VFVQLLSCVLASVFLQFPVAGIWAHRSLERMKENTRILETDGMKFESLLLYHTPCVA